MILWIRVQERTESTHTHIHIHIHHRIKTGRKKEGGEREREDIPHNSKNQEKNSNDIRYDTQYKKYNRIEYIYIYIYIYGVIS